MSTQRLLRLTLAAGLVGTFAAALPSHAAGCSSVRDAGNGWLTSRPGFTAGPAAVVRAVATAFEPDQVYATNGVQLARTGDAGCTWAVVFDASAPPSAGAPGRLTAFAAPSSPNSSDQLYVATAVDLVGGVSRPQVWASPDRGQAGSWITPSDPVNGGLPPVGEVTELTASAGAPRSAYALVHAAVAAVTSDRLYATTDSGASWASRNDQVAPTHLLAGLTRGNELLGLDHGRLLRSTDGGRAFTDITPKDRTLDEYDAAVAASSVRVVGAHANQPDFADSTDGGTSWTTRPSAVNAVHVAAAPVQDLVAVTDEHDLVLQAPAVGARPVPAPRAGGVPDQLDVSAASAAGFALTGVTGGRVARLVLSLDLSVVTPVNGPVHLIGSRGHQFPATLYPDALTLRIRAGESRLVPYRLLMPRTPSPADLMFLVDTTGSMGGVIAQLQANLQALVNATQASGLNARFGLGDFQDYPGAGGGPDDVPYRLDRRLGPGDAQMAKAINDLALGGGGDGPETGLTALYQSTTGAGESWRGRQVVPRGKVAGYRAGALRLAITATDAPFHYRGDDAGTPGPSFAETTTALIRADVHVIGLSVDETDLERMARETHTVAPPAGVDCDGDGVIDLESGQPIVCDVSDLTTLPVGVSGPGVPTAPTTGKGSGLVDAITSFADAIADVRPVSISVSNGGDVARITSGALHSVNLKANQELAARVRVSCPQARTTHSHRIGLRAALPGRQLATAEIAVRCEAPPARVVPAVVPPGQPGEVVEAQAPAGPAAPAQAPPQAPNPNPNPNPAPNANAGAVHEEQANAQLALAEDHGEGLVEDLSMSRVRGPDALFAGSAGLLFMAASGVALQRRRRSVRA